MAVRFIPFPGAGLPGPRIKMTGRTQLIVGLGALLLVVLLAIYYLITHRPVTSLPGLQQVAKPVPPVRLFAFAGVANPIGIAVAPDGQRIYVAEGGGERLIRVFDRGGKPIAQLSPPASQPGTREPGEIGVDAQGRLYVAERMRAEVQTYSPSLQWEGGFRPSILDELKGWLPNGVSVGADGRVYVADIGSTEHQVLVLGSDGSLAQRLSESTGVPGGLSYPIQAVADDAGRIYVSDGNHGRVLAISPRGVQVLSAAGKEALGLPRGLAVWGDKLFVADSRGNRIAVFSTGDRPQYLYDFGQSSGSDGLAYPNAVAVDRAGRVYVADRANDQVQVWTY